MSDFKKRLDEYEPRKSCKGCIHYENGDWDTDKCLKIECDDRCDDEGICMNDLESFYKLGRADEYNRIIGLLKSQRYAIVDNEGDYYSVEELEEVLNDECIIENP